MPKAKKSVSLKLNPDKLQELKDAIISGESPKSIHERLGASLANIHYHKAELKKKGLLKGSTTGKATQANETIAKPATVKKAAKASSKTATVAGPKIIAKREAFKLIVNGVSVHIEGAGSVSVGEGFIKVDF